MIAFGRSDRSASPATDSRRRSPIWQPAQQFRNATPFGQGPQFIIRDRDDKFGAVFDRVASGAGARVVRTAVQAPDARDDDVARLP